MEISGTTPRILIADDEESMRFLLREVMKREGYEADTASNGLEAVAKVREQDFDLVILDMRMPEMDGMTALKEIRRVRPHLIVVIITAHGNTSLAVEAMRNGAYDYFNKPFELDEMRVVVRRALEKQSLLNQITDLEQKLRQRVNFDRIIGQSDPMQRVFALLEKVVVSDVTVLITGESGTGKELIAQAVHYQSPRRAKPFVSINCAAIPESLLESELFGHEKGSFTGAIGTKIGRFEAASGGSLFLDEIGDMPLQLQSKVLRALQEREILRVGGNRAIKVDLRIIAATNRDLLQAVDDKSFREDLYFRLHVLPVHLPPLRSRTADIPLLIQHFLGVHNPRLNKNIVGMAPDALELMMHYTWPGNIRELENVMQRCMVMAAGTVIQRDDLPANIVESSGPLPKDFFPTSRDAAGIVPGSILNDFSKPLADKMEQLAEAVEPKIINAALEKCNGKRQATADLLGISRKSLHNKMARYGLFGKNDTEGGD